MYVHVAPLKLQPPLLSMGLLEILFFIAKFFQDVIDASDDAA